VAGQVAVLTETGRFWSCRSRSWRRKFCDEAIFPPDLGSDTSHRRGTPQAAANTVVIMPDRRRPPIAAGQRRVPRSGPHRCCWRPGGGGEPIPSQSASRWRQPRGTRSCLGVAGRRSPPPPGNVTSQSRGTLIESGTQRGSEGLAARPLRWSVARASGSGARPLAVSRRSVSGRRSTARGAGKAVTPRTAREARYCPHRSPAWRPRSTPAVKCATGWVRKVADPLLLRGVGAAGW